MPYAPSDLSCMPPIRSGLSPQARFLWRPQLLNRVSPLPVGRDIFLLDHKGSEGLSPGNRSCSANLFYEG